MNAKCKTTASAVTRTLGRPVGVLPLGPRSAAPPDQRRTSSVERRILKRTSSTGSIGTLSSSRPKPEPGSANIKSQSARRRLQTNREDFQQNARLADKRATNESSSECQKPNGLKEGNKGLTTDDILKLGHEETEPCRVFDVDLHGKGLTFTPDLGKFQKLKILDLSSNCLRRISGLDSNMDLRDLKIYDNQLTAIEGLEQTKELSCLQLQHNKITAIGRGLNNLKKLQSLRLDNNQIARLEIPELVSCSNITSLDVSHNRLESVAPLSYLPNLEELFAAGNIIQKIGDLTKCKKLQEIDLARNQISQLAGLANLPNLQILDISSNHIKSLKSLGKLRSMQQLNINGNQVEKLSSFGSLFPSLQILYACNNMVSKWEEICSLSGCAALVEIDVTGNPFTMEGGEMPDYHHAAQQALPNLEVIDGVSLKRPGSKQDKPDSTPLMRPMTASSTVSIRQIDSHLKASTEEQGNLFRDFTERFDALRSLVESLPSQPPRSSRGTSASSKCSSRSRLAEAQKFAVMNVVDGKEGDSL